MGKREGQYFEQVNGFPVNAGRLIDLGAVIKSPGVRLGVDGAARAAVTAVTLTLSVTQESTPNMVSMRGQTLRAL